MMDRIKELPDSVKRKIAAGEVVEGPFSVVKELIENSLDAESTEIDVEIYESGLKKIQVRDNGSGMFRDDLPSAIREHTTSKIENFTDIERVATYGFRGEALSSISSISKLTIYTRSSEEERGAKLTSVDGSVEMHDYAGAAGTMIIVENLFFNVPARKKFLRARKTELRKVRETFLRIALANPDVSFSLSIDGRRQVTLPAAADSAGRIQQIYGDDILERLSFERIQDIKIELSGYLSMPDLMKPSRSMQVLYVNRRPVEYRYLGFLLSRAYEAMAAQGHPVAFLFLTIDPELVDINVHPAKREVKFFDQKYIDDCIIHLSQKAVNRVHRVRDNLIKPGGDQFAVSALSEGEGSSSSSEEGAGMSLFEHDGRSYGMRSFLKDVSELYSAAQGEPWRLLGIIYNRYILVEDARALLIIDFHAAHERFIFDILMQGTLAVETQDLVFPVVLELSLDEHPVAMDCLALLREIGFDIEEFSDNSVVIRGIPVLGRGMDVELFFHEVLDALKSEQDMQARIQERIFEKVACHSAKRSGDELTDEDVLLIIRETRSGAHELRCPHGRPYVYAIERNDLERIFKRS